jgi:hypothetical protein
MFAFVLFRTELDGHRSEQAELEAKDSKLPVDDTGSYFNPDFNVESQTTIISGSAEIEGYAFSNLKLPKLFFFSEKNLLPVTVRVTVVQNHW